MSASDQLLVVIDPFARRADGESVRIAKDVLGAGAHVKVCLPDGPVEFARVLARRGARRPVVVGDDRALLRAVTLLHRERELGSCALALVPVGARPSLALARSLGIPASAVAAARTVLEGVQRRLDLLVDDSGGVVLGGLGIPPGPHARESDAPPGAPAAADEAPGGHWLRTCQSLVRTLAARPAKAEPARLLVEADGVPLVDLDQPIERLAVAPDADGLARVEVHPARPPGAAPSMAGALRTRARTLTVSGADFRYRADVVVGGPVRTRTWTVQPGAWTLTLPRAPGG